MERIEYIDIVDSLEKTIEILKKEYKDIIVKEINKGLIIGDLHGDYISLLKALEFYNNEYLIFLGDYVDRGKYQIETLYKILQLKLELKDKVILLRGNHEFFKIEFYPHDFPDRLEEYFGEKWKEIYELFREFTNYLPFVLYIPEFAIILHGGIPKNLDFINNLEEIDKIDIVWNDPFDGIGFRANIYRGIGRLFGRDIVEKVIEKYKVKYIIRGHSPPCEFNKLITVFTSKEPYKLNKACILKFENKEPKMIYI